jgi:hypothetical protein
MLRAGWEIDSLAFTLGNKDTLTPHALEYQALASRPVRRTWALIVPLKT